MNALQFFNDELDRAMDEVARCRRLRLGNRVQPFSHSIVTQTLVSGRLVKVEIPFDEVVEMEILGMKVKVAVTDVRGRLYWWCDA